MANLTLPEFAYDPSTLALSEDDKLYANALLTDYYGKMATNYLPMIDEFAKTNAGQMVSYDPNFLMSMEDFGFNGVRGSLSDFDLLQNSHNLNNWSGDDTSTAYYTKTPDGQYRIATGAEGEELFTLGQAEPSWENDFQGGEVYTPAGNYHRETPQEAAARLLAQGGGYKTEGQGAQRSDFMGATTLQDLLTDNSGKWGKDFLGESQLQQYLDNPAWVSKDENGNITAIRSELYPLLMREALVEEQRDIVRGNTDQAAGLGGLVKMGLLGLVTSGMGLAGAQALGMGGTAAAGAGMGATAAGMGTAGMATAGGISGLLSAALTEQDLLKGLTTGVILGGAGGLIKDYAPGISESIGMNDLAGKKLGTQITGGAMKGLVNGTLYGDPLKGVLAGTINPIVGTAVNSALGDVNLGSFGNSVLGGAAGGLTNAVTNQLVGNDVDVWDSILSGVIFSGVRNALGQTWNAAKGVFEDDAETPKIQAAQNTQNIQSLEPVDYSLDFKGSNASMLPVSGDDFTASPAIIDDINNAVNSLSNTDIDGNRYKVSWGFEDGPGTDSLFSPNDSAGIPYNAPNGGTTMDYDWEQAADIFDTFGIDPYNLDGWNVGFGEGVGIGDFDWEQALGIFNDFGVDPYNFDSWDLGNFDFNPWTNLPPSDMPLEPIDWSITDPTTLPWVDTEADGPTVDQILTGDTGDTPWTNLPPSDMPLEPVDWSTTDPKTLPWVDTEPDGPTVDQLIAGDTGDTPWTNLPPSDMPLEPIDWSTTDPTTLPWVDTEPDGPTVDQILTGDTGDTPWTNLPPSDMPLEPVDWSTTDPKTLPWVDTEPDGPTVDQIIAGGGTTPGTTDTNFLDSLKEYFGGDFKDLLPWLLGGTALAGALSDNDPSVTSTTSTSKPDVPDWYNQAQQTLAGQLAALPIVSPQYTQPLAAGISGNEQSGVDMADQVTGAWAPQFANAVNQATRTALTIPETDLTQYMNPYIAEVLAPTLRGVNQNFDERLNNLNAASVSRGAFGGSRNSLLMGLNEENRARALGEETGKGFSNAFNYATDTALKDRKALLDTATTLGSMSGDYQRMLSGDVNQLMSTGAAERGITNDLYTKQYTDFTNQLKYPLDAMGAYSGALNAVSPKVYGTTNTTTTTGPKPNMWSNLLGMGATGISLYNQLFPSTPAATTGTKPATTTTVGDVSVAPITDLQPDYSLPTNYDWTQGVWATPK